MNFTLLKAQLFREQCAHCVLTPPSSFLLLLSPSLLRFLLLLVSTAYRNWWIIILHVCLAGQQHWNQTYKYVCFNNQSVQWRALLLNLLFRCQEMRFLKHSKWCVLSEVVFCVISVLMEFHGLCFKPCELPTFGHRRCIWRVKRFIKWFIQFKIFKSCLGVQLTRIWDMHTNTHNLRDKSFRIRVGSLLKSHGKIMLGTNEASLSWRFSH